MAGVAIDPTAPGPEGERELSGPSATGGGWRRIWEIVRINASADYRLRFAGSRLGYAWIVIRPITYFGVLYVVITEIFAAFAGVPNYGSMLLFNIMVFTYFAEAVTGAVRSLGSGGIIRKAELPVAALPLGSVMSATYAFAGNLGVVVIWILVAGVDPGLGWLAFPLLLAWLVALVVGISLLLSAAWVRNRDVSEGWPSVTRLLFYASPILYPIEQVPDGILSDVMSLNPLAPILVIARKFIIDPDAPGWFDDRSLVLALLPILLGVVIFAVGAAIFARRSRTAAEEI